MNAAAVLGVTPAVVPRRPHGSGRASASSSSARSSASFKLAAARVNNNHKHRRLLRQLPTRRVPITTAAASSDGGEGGGKERSQPAIPRVTRPQPPPGTVEVVVRYTFPGVRFSQGRVAIVHASQSSSPPSSSANEALSAASAASSGPTAVQEEDAGEPKLMSWREALADVNKDDEEEEEDVRLYKLNPVDQQAIA
jgi:hypothetical protein